MDFLDNHPLWVEAQKSVPTERAKKRTFAPIRNALALDELQDNLFCHVEGVEDPIRVVHLKPPVRTGAGGCSTPLACEPPLGFPVLEMIFNKRSDCLCAVGHHTCAIIEISSNLRRKLAKNQAASITCRTNLVGDSFYTNNPLLYVQKAAWHPLSDNHLAILTSDNTLRLYDLASDPAEPEQTFRLSELYPYKEELDSRAIDFAFGLSRIGWDCFTIYFLMEGFEGEVFALAPVVPFNILVPECIFVDLKNKVTASRDESQQGKEEDERYQTQLGWLSGVVTQVVIELEDWEAERGRLGKNRAPAKKKVQPRAEGWLLTRKPQDQRLLTPILHGPLKPAEGFGAPKEEQLPVGIISIPSSPTVIIRSFLNGFLDILLSFDIEPDWPHLRPRMSHSNRDRSAQSLITFERIDLGLPTMLADLDLKDEQEENEMLLSSLVPMMSLDPIKKGCVYIRHSAGIHLLRLSWLDKLEQFSQSSDSQLPELPPSELEILLHTVPSLSDSPGEPAPLLGFAVLRNAAMHNYWIAITSDWKCLHGRLDGALYSGTIPSALAVQAEPDGLGAPNPSAGQIVSFEDTIRPLMEKKLFRIPPIATRGEDRLSFSSEEALKFMIEKCQFLRREYVLYIQDLSAQILKQVEVLRIVQEHQEQRVKEISNTLIELKKNANVLQNNLQKAKEVQEILTDRSKNIMDVIRSQRGGLSLAEEHFFQELQEKQQMARAFKCKIEQLLARSDVLLKEQEENNTGVAIGNRLIKKIEPIVEEEANLIEKIVKEMKQLQLHVNQAFPDSS